MKVKIPWAKPDYWGKEREYVLNAFDSTWISGGEYVDKLEHDFEKWLKIKYAITASNGTTAIHLAYLGAEIMPGDEIIIPGFCFLAAANVALNMGAKPVFADVDPETWCMTAESVSSVLSEKTRAIVPVHTYGNACDMDEINSLAKSKKILVIEDAAESIGTKYKGQLTGSIGDIGCFSFQATKTITTGEGGLVVTNNKDVANKMGLFRSHGMSRKRYWHDVAGLNFRLTNLQAAIGCAQFEKIDLISSARNTVDKLYRKHLESIEGIECQYYREEVDAVVWAVAVKLSSNAFPQGRDKVMEEMYDSGIETRPGFYAAELMEHLYQPKFSLPVSLELSKQIISLPSSPSLTEQEIIFICSTLNSLRR